MNSAPADTQRFPTALLVFTLSYVVLASIASWLTGNREFIFYIVVMAVLIAVMIRLLPIGD